MAILPRRVKPTLDGEQPGRLVLDRRRSVNGGRAKTDWESEPGRLHAFFDHQLWMLGGMRSWDDFGSDVWSSTNGTEWKQVTPHAGWAARRNHAAVVFRNKLWVIGEQRVRAMRTECRAAFNDAWSSADGVDWIG
jgi:hypothetical protein